MNKGDFILARRYANAFLNTVDQNVLTRDFVVACACVGDQLVQLREWLAVLELPMITGMQRENMLKILKEESGLPGAATSLVDLLYAHGRMKLLPEILIALKRFYFQRIGLVQFSVQSSCAIGEATRQNIEDFLGCASGKQVLCDYESNIHLIAGMRACSDELFWEYSVAKKLREAQQAVYKDTL